MFRFFGSVTYAGLYNVFIDIRTEIAHPMSRLSSVIAICLDHILTIICKTILEFYDRHFDYYST